jgi:hypothetical protein
MKKLVLSAIGVMGLIAGCCHHKPDHIAGVCDCDPRTWGCRTGPGADHMIYSNGNAHPGVNGGAAAKEMPK